MGVYRVISWEVCGWDVAVVKCGTLGHAIAFLPVTALRARFGIQVSQPFS